MHFSETFLEIEVLAVSGEGKKTTIGILATLLSSVWNCPNPVLRSHCAHGFLKQHVRDHLLLRTEPATNNVNDYGVNKGVGICPNCAPDCKVSSIVISTSSRAFSKPLWTVDSCSTSRPYCPTASESPVEDRSSPPTRSNAGSGPLFSHRGWRHLHQCRPIPRSQKRWISRFRLLTRLSPVRAVKTPIQRTGRKGPHIHGGIDCWRVAIRSASFI